MKLRFSVDQASCFRRGIDCPKSIVTIDVDPADIPQEERDLIADRLVGIDVLKLISDERSEASIQRKTYTVYVRQEIGNFVRANGTSYADLMNAIRDEEDELLTAFLDSHVVE